MQPRKPVMLVASFGTSYADTRAQTLDVIERELTEAFPDFEVRRAYTSDAVIRTLKKRDGITVDSVPQALERLIREGVSRVLVQPTHMMPGGEYDTLTVQSESFRDGFQKLLIGTPLLNSEEDCALLAKILDEKTCSLQRPDTALVWMGHGSERGGNECYTSLQQAFAALRKPHHLVGTVKGGAPVKQAQALGVSRVVLLPMMMVAGAHAAHDMAGEEPSSWKNQFLQAGFQAECVRQGIGVYPEVRSMILRHGEELAEIMNSR